MLPTLILAAALAGLAPGLEQVLERTPSDSLLAPLKRYEQAQHRGARAAEAAQVLGHLHLARSRFRLAAEAFGRAAAGFDADRKPEARYWAGVAWLAAGDPRRARAQFEAVERDGGAREGLATLGEGISWLRENQPEHAERVLARLVERRDAREALPGALEMLATAADRLGHAEQARRARERLRREFPRSFEAHGAAPASPGTSS